MIQWLALEKNQWLTMTTLETIQNNAEKKYNSSQKIKQTYEQNSKNKTELVSKGKIPPVLSEVMIRQTHVDRGDKIFEPEFLEMW